MSISQDFPIHSLSVSEKLILLERLWGDLSQRPADIPSPDWHGEILAQRLRAVQDGKTSFVDWEDAKARLREKRQ